MECDKCTKYDLFSEISQQTLKMYIKLAIITTFWHSAKLLGYVHQRPVVPDRGTQYE